MMKKIERDKWKHFYVGIFMGAFLQAFCWYFLPLQLVWISLFAFSLVITISYGFEVFSKISGMGHYEVLDAVASSIGGILGMAIILVGHHIFYP